MTYEAFVEEVCWRTGLQSREAARQAVATTLETIGRRLSPWDALAVEGELPPPLSTFVAQAQRHEVFEVGELYERVAQAEPVRLGMAVEHAKVVCEVLTEALDNQGRFHLRSRLPPEWAGLFVLPRARPHVDEPLSGATRPRLGTPTTTAAVARDSRTGPRTE